MLPETPWEADLLVGVACAVAAYTVLGRTDWLVAFGSWCSGACCVLALTKWMEGRRDAD